MSCNCSPANVPTLPTGCINVAHGSHNYVLDCIVQFLQPDGKWDCDAPETLTELRVSVDKGLNWTYKQL
jgi:hypothetical protein